ncbi:hypothetical protein QTI24_07615 [Variovorax sp. J22P240]|uniref:XVIPCD domain-containing protein n=1 Tax=Variovorax sp. J22P240 TaxID=3053514 RepID=UPI002576B622|nr:XVIPCD domain-containing protein [Variovorax sp. J22P240]MDL9998461.1 hypothetical protein [Variovorax sp. J22P240]
MTIGTHEHAVLANDTYGDRSKNLGKDPVPIDGVNYKVLAVVDRPSGYQGTAYQRVDTGEFIIAHRGTESINDGITDIGMALRGRSNQLDDALAFTKHAVELARKTESNYPHSIAISITGHSLGGTLAEITAAKYDLPAETFNAYGPTNLKNLKDYGVNMHGQYPNIVNHVRATDVVGAGSAHLGEVHTYAAPQDIENLRRGRYLESGSLYLPTNPLLTADLSAHKMGNFLPNNDVIGESVLSPVNEARARAYHGAIAHYRRDVVQGRIDLAAIAHRAPSPLHQFNPLDTGVKLKAQALDAGVTMGGHAVADGVVQAGRAAVQGAKIVGDGASRTYSSLTGSLFGSKQATPSPSPPLNQPAHPAHALFKQAQVGVHKMDADVGRAPDPRSDQLAACLVVAARSDGMNRIDHVSLSTDASKVFAVQGALNSPLKQITSVPTVKSLNTPIAQSSATLQQAMQHKAQDHQVPSQVQQQDRQQAQRHAGPAMSM